jgi:hypothetical protein
MDSIEFTQLDRRGLADYLWQRFREPDRTDPPLSAPSGAEVAEDFVLKAVRAVQDPPLRLRVIDALAKNMYRLEERARRLPEGQSLWANPVDERHLCSLAVVAMELNARELGSQFYHFLLPWLLDPQRVPTDLSRAPAMMVKALAFLQPRGRMGQFWQGLWEFAPRYLRGMILFGWSCADPQEALRHLSGLLPLCEADPALLPQTMWALTKGDGPGLDAVGHALDQTDPAHLPVFYAALHAAGLDAVDLLRLCTLAPPTRKCFQSILPEVTPADLEFQLRRMRDSNVSADILCRFVKAARPHPSAVENYVLPRLPWRVKEGHGCRQELALIVRELAEDYPSLADPVWLLNFADKYHWPRWAVEATAPVFIRVSETGAWVWFRLADLLVPFLQKEIETLDTKCDGKMQLVRMPASLQSPVESLLSRFEPVRQKCPWASDRALDEAYIAWVQGWVTDKALARTAAKLVVAVMVTMNVPGGSRSKEAMVTELAEQIRRTIAALNDPAAPTPPCSPAILMPTFAADLAQWLGKTFLQFLAEPFPQLGGLVGRS